MKNLAILFLCVLVLSPLMGVENAQTLGYAFAGAIGISLILAQMKQAGFVFDTVIPIQDAQGLFTKKLIAVYKEKIDVKGFLRSFFVPVESMTKEVSIAVRRGSERVAVDVHRYSDGNRNTFSKSTEKIFVPPYFYEYLTANDHRLYDQVITALSQGNTTFFAEMTQELADDLFELQKKIDRATELMCAQVLLTGILTFNASTNINFQRKAASLVDLGAGNYWTTGTVSPYETIKVGCEFLRTKGKSQGGTFNLILGSTALDALLNNTIVKERNDLKDMSLDAVRAPQRDALGYATHGQISVGSYTVRLWTYPEFYENANGDMVEYITPNKVILLPENPEFKLAYAAVPQLIGAGGTIPQKGRYLIQEFFDEKQTSHQISIKSAPVPVPVAIDQIWTAKVVA